MTWFEQLFGRKQRMVTADAAIAGRSTPMPVVDRNVVTGQPMVGPFPDHLRAVVLAAGCFWGVEEIFWQLPGVRTTAVGYAGGFTANPTYEEVCTAQTGHTESVLVVFDPQVIGFDDILRVFWEAHDPTQGMRQGNDAGTQYRSAIYTFDHEDAARAHASAKTFEAALADAHLGPVTTEISPLSQAGDGHFYYAEDHHQQYLFKNPHGYRCHSSTGLRYPA